MRGLLLVLFLPFSVCAQFADDFGDGDFTNNPAWAGDVAKFEVDGNFRLHLNAPAVADTGWLSTLSDTIDNAFWECYVEMAFNPSSANYAKIYVVSDQADLNGPLNGYFVKVGNTSDEISLYRQNGLAETEIIDGLDGRVNLATVTARIRVTRDNAGNWQLLSDTTGGTNWFSEGAALDNTHTSTNYFGVHCTYTSTRSDKFWFDDIFASLMPLDTVPPQIASLQVLSATQLDVRFNEYVQQASAETPANYPADNGIGSPSTAVRDGADSTLVHLTFGTSFPMGIWNTLTVNNVQDLSGNATASEQDSFLYFVYQPAAAGDVVINEIMADPSPPVALPDAEFIELHNRSNKVFDLFGWQFTDGVTTGTLPAYLFAPGEYVILCATASASLFAPYGNVIGIAWPSLNNTGDSLSLRDSSFFTVDEVAYTDNWYRDNAKDDGGWSLELINPFDSCKGEFNWLASTHANGGTPGAQNSVYDITPDAAGPLLLSAELVSADTLTLTFDEPLDSASIAAGSYGFSPSLTVLSVSSAPLQPHVLWLVFSTPVDTGVNYLLTISGLTDCPGNAMAQATVPFVLPFAGKPGDLLINEVLFNPVPNSVDFVEIYNHSGTPVSLRDWKLANYDDDTIANFKTIASETFVVQPQTYWVLTTDSAKVKQAFPLARAGTFLQLSSLPNYNNDSGTVYLINAAGVVIDRFSYSDTMHFALINDTEGKSLERLDFKRPASDPTNWHTAAQSAGFATPGYENSQYHPAGEPEGAVTLSPEVFSPDNDGLDDVLNISWDFGQAGFVGNITIFDARGRTVRLLMRNELLGTSGTVSWNGENEAGEKARIGLHVVYFEVFDLAGKVIKFKKPCVVATKL